MFKARTGGAARAQHDLGLVKLAQSSISALEVLAAPSFLNKIESLLVPAHKPPPVAPVPVDPIINAERTYLKKRYNVTTHLSGSMPLDLAIPHEVDIDLFVRAESPTKFKNLVRKLNQNPRYTPSPYNKPHAGYQVYQRPAESEKDYPVDLAIAFGDPAKDYRTSLRTQQELAKTLPDDLRKRLIAKKYLLKNSPIDFKHKRYKAWKRGLDKALGGGYRLDRKEVDALKKVAEVIDLNDPDALSRFQRFTTYKDMYGHRTPHIEALLESQGLMSALEALKRGKLRSFEAGSSAGTHQTVTHNELTNTQLQKIETAMLTATPQTSVFDTVATETNRSPTAVKADFLRQDFHKIKKFLNSQDDPEQFRKTHFSISKLSPNIFVTKGGILDTDAYGDHALLLRSRTAKKSPYMNLVTDEHIIPPKAVFNPRRLAIGSGYVLAPKAKIKALDEAHPNVKFVATEDIPEPIKAKIYKPVHSYKETWERWIPHALRGDLSISQTK